MKRLFYSSNRMENQGYVLLTVAEKEMVPEAVPMDVSEPESGSYHPTPTATEMTTSHQTIRNKLQSSIKKSRVKKHGVKKQKAMKEKTKQTPARYEACDES
ncbi:MAG: hypothetical protein WC208_13850 [Gallionella sp.]